MLQGEKKATEIICDDDDEHRVLAANKTKQKIPSHAEICSKCVIEIKCSILTQLILNEFHKNPASFFNMRTVSAPKYLTHTFKQNPWNCVFLSHFKLIQFCSPFVRHRARESEYVLYFFHSEFSAIPLLAVDGWKRLCTMCHTTSNFYVFRNSSHIISLGCRTTNETLFSDEIRRRDAEDQSYGLECHAIAYYRAFV